MANAPRKRKQLSVKLKLLIAFVLVGVIGGFSYLTLKKEKPAETFAAQPIKRGELVDKLADTGTIELVRTVEVKSTIAGEVRRLLVEAGDWVEEGQELVIIEPDPNQSLQLYQKRAAVDRSEIDLKEQERNFDRQRKLFEKNLLSTKDIEDAERNLTQARNQLHLAVLELEILETKANLKRGQAQGKADLDEVQVLAPISGIVIRRGVENGEVVASGLSSFSGGTLLFEIGDPSQMIVRGDIAEIDIGKLHVGQQVEVVADAYPDTTYRGRVRWIAPVGEKKQGNPIVTFDTEIDIIDRDPRLRQGMSCDIDIIFDRRDSTMFLPTEMTLEDFDETEDGEEVKGQRGRFVAYVVRGDSTNGLSETATENTLNEEATNQDTSQADARPDSAAKDPSFELESFVEVELGIGLETSTRIEILSGLQQGDLVAEDPQLIRRKIKEQQEQADKDEEK